MPSLPLNEICAAVRDLFDARTCAIAAVRDVEELEFVAGDGDGMSNLHGTRLRVGEGIAGYVAQTGLPVEVHDALADERFASHFSVHRDFVPASLLGAPLRGPGDEVTGVLTVLDPSVEALHEVSQEVGSPLPLLQVMAGQISELLVGQELPDSVYAGPSPSTFANADANRR